jgi:hypothetical protein
LIHASFPYLANPIYACHATKEISIFSTCYGEFLLDSVLLCHSALIAALIAALKYNRSLPLPLQEHKDSPWFSLQGEG